MPEVSLHRLFDFTDADLEANRAGHLTQRQRDRLHEQARQAAADKAATIVTTPVVILLIALYFVLVPPLGNRLGPAMCVVIGAVIPGIIALGYGLWHTARYVVLRLLRRPNAATWLRSYARAHAAIEQAVVAADSGVLSNRSDGEHEYIFLGDKELQSSVSADADERLSQLAPGQAYTIYRVGGTDWIVAVEAATDSPAAH